LPPLRLGFVVAPPDLIERLVAYRSYADLQGDPALECALAELLDDGLIQRHVRKMRPRCGGSTARAPTRWPLCCAGASKGSSRSSSPGFASLTEDEIRTAVRRLVAAAEA
jgi:hypothetical protein